MKNIPFSPPDITQEEIDEVVEALKSGWITTGPRTKELERLIAEYCGTAKAACMNSQTACAEMTLRLLGIGEGDEVIVPAYTYTATCSVVIHTGAVPVIIDCAPGSYEMDYDKLEEAINTKTKCIIPVDLAGKLCDYDRIFQAAERKKHLFRPNSSLQEAIGRVIVLADSAHSFGAVQKGARSGQIADFSAFSFHAVKNLTTAEGGCAVWKSIDGIDDDEIYRQFMLLSLHGQTKDALAKSVSSGWEYDIVAPYYKCNMTDLAAAIGLVQLRRYDEMTKKRHRIIKKYDEAFAGLDIALTEHETADSVSSGHLYMTGLPGRDIGFRNTAIEKMSGLGVSCNVHYKPLPLLSAYKGITDAADYPNAVRMYESEITLPLHTLLTDDDTDYIIEAFIKIAGD